MKKLLLIACASAALTACHGSNNPVESAKQAAKDKDLQGKNFVSECNLSAKGVAGAILSGGTIDLKHYTTTIRVDGDRLTRSTRYYVDNNCQGDNALVFEESGDIQLNPDKRTGDQGKAIDINFDKLMVTTVTDDGVKAANALTLCSAADWSPKSSRDETAHSDEAKCINQKFPLKLYTVYRIDDKTLYFVGQPGAATAEAQRPDSATKGDKFTAQ